MSVKLKVTGWELGGQPLPWLWGQINYWDLERAHWRDVLRTYHERGNLVVSTTVLPRVHQTAPGHYDFGSVNPSLDLAEFARTAAELGLKLVVWLGPRDVPGVAAAGYPEDLLRDEAALARDAAGGLIVSPPGFGGDVFCLPSLLAPATAHSLEPFAHQVTKVLAPLIHPDGPVIGIGLTQAPGWWPALPAFAADYHPAALARYREFLRQTYRRIGALNAAYGTQAADFEAVEPPRGLTGAEDPLGPRLQDWARGREDYFVQAAERVFRLFAPVAQDRIPVFLAGLPTASRPYQGAELDLLRGFAFTLPEPPPLLGPEQELAFWRAQAGQARFLAWFQARPETDGELLDDDGKSYLLQCRLAAGVRAWDAVAPAGSGALPGFLMDRRGATRHGSDAFWEALREQARSEGFLNSQTHADVVLLTLPEWERALYLQTPASPRHDLVDLPPVLPKPICTGPSLDYQARVLQLDHWLLSGQYAYAHVEGDCDWARFSEKQLLVVPGAPTLAAEFQARIVAALERGSEVVIAGPLPAHPEGAAHASLADWAGGLVKPPRGAERGRAKAPKPGRLHHLPEPNEAKFDRLLKQIGVVREVTFDAPGLHVTFQRFRNRIFIAVNNPGPEPVETVARREGKFVLKDFWQTRKFLGGNQEIRLTLPPRSVKFWELIPC